MNIIIMGPQASGKGTQAKLIEKEFGLGHFSTGDALREEIKSGSHLGQKIASIINQGHLVGDNLIFEMVKKGVEKLPQGVVIDGFPRKVSQAQMMQGIIPIDHVIEIDITDETAIKRISSRYVCSKCSHGYNTVSLPPKKEGVCDLDGSPLVQRDDDKPQAVHKRLALFYEVTKPVVEYYEKIGVPIFRINGEGSIEEVFAKIKEFLENV